MLTLTFFLCLFLLTVNPLFWIYIDYVCVFACFLQFFLVLFAALRISLTEQISSSLVPS